MTTMEKDEGDDFDIEALVSELSVEIKTAEDFMDSAFGSDRERAEKYFNGETDVPVDGNRSQYVATKVRDTIRAVRPSLLRSLLSTSTPPVTFRPTGAANHALARQQTLFVNQQFHAAGGYMAVNNAIQNASLHKVGPVQYWWEDTSTADYRTYSNLSAEAMQALQSMPNIEIISSESEEITVIAPSGEMVQEPIFKAEVAITRKSGCIKIEPTVLSEFIIDEGAVNGRPPGVIGRARNMTVSEILKTYPDIEKEDLDDLDAASETDRASGESAARRGYVRRGKGKKPIDESKRLVFITDVYWEADLDGTGIAQMWRWVLGGTTRKLLHYERAEDGHNFALFQLDPKPGAVFGTSLYDLTHNDQDGITSATRGVIDNLHSANTPRIAYHETMVNADDVLNWDIAAPIRMRAPGMIQVVDVPFVGASMQPFLEYWNNDVENKTGVSRASLGLDPRALQSADKEAVQQTIQSGAGQTDVMARNLAETGMVPLFRGILRLCLRHQNPHQVVWITGDEYVTVDIRNFDPELTLEAAVGLNGMDDEKTVMALERVMTLQEKIIGAFGPTNPVVKPHHVTQTMQDYILAIGLRDPSRYMQNLTPDEGDALIEQLKQQASAPPPPDPTVEAMKEAENIKAQGQMAIKQLDSDLRVREKAVAARIDLAKAVGKDDLERDKMLQDLYIAAGKLALEGGKLEVAAIQAQQAATKGGSE